MTKTLRLTVLIFLFGVCVAGPLLAQQHQIILFSGNFTNSKFSLIANAIEAKTGYHFFYSRKDIDSLTFNIAVSDKDVLQVLDELFQGSDLHYALDGQKNIFITRGRELQVGLPDDFFDTGKKSENRYNTALLDFLSDEKKERARKSAEDKLYPIGKRTKTIGTGNASLAGYVRSYESGEAIVGASVYITDPAIGAVTDQFGYYSITMPKGLHDLNIKSLGSKTTKRRIILYTDGKLDIEIQEQVTSLNEVLIESDKDKNISSTQMGVDKIDIKTMKQIPGILGEADILRVVMALPGVQSVGEGSTGLNVRGGGTSQNLILFNDATIYNPSHLFGFFSAFNPDVLKNAELYKSGIPAEYGGRISSVLDVNSREGNKKKFSGSGGISPITGRLTLEGPIITDKTSFLIGARSTYSDWLLKQIPNQSIKNSGASFYDVNASISHEINEKNNIYITGYLSRDHFTLNNDTSYTYQNKALTGKFKHVFGNKIYGVLTGSYSGYDYKVSSVKIPSQAAQLNYGINQLSGKADFNYYPNPQHSINFGVSTIHYSLNPGTYKPVDSASLVVPKKLQNEQAQESAIYVGDHYDVNEKIALYGGIRYSYYNYLGPKDVNTYAAGVSKDISTIMGVVHYGAGKSIINYGGPEYRFSARYSLPGNSAIKLSYNRTRQYLQMLSNTTSISPTDYWKLSDTYVKPQIGDQVALGLYKNLRGNTIELSVEGYYKKIQNTIDYKSGDSLLLNKHIETALLNGRGKAYGVEFLMKKTAGKLNGWVSYTYSRSFLKTTSPYPADNPNNGNWYPSNYDKPHAVNFIGNYKLSHRFSFSLNTIYSTGRPITLPIAQYTSEGVQRLFYSERNQYRVPNYFRMDISMNVEGNHKVKKFKHSSWTFGIYNLTGRKNPYSIFFESSNGVVKGYKLSIFGPADTNSDLQFQILTTPNEKVEIITGTKKRNDLEASAERPGDRINYDRFSAMHRSVQLAESRQHRIPCCRRVS